MNPFGRLLAAKFKPEKILEYLKNTFPQYSDKIAKLVGAGFSAQKIIEFFENPESFNKLKLAYNQNNGYESNPNPLVEAENVKRGGQNDAASRAGNAVTAGLKMGATALGGYALSRAVPSILQKVAPGIIQSPIPPKPPSRQPLLGNNSTPLPSNSQPITPTPAPAAPTYNIGNFTRTLSNYLKTNPNISPEDMSAVMRKLHPEEAKRIEKGNKKPLEQVLESIIPAILKQNAETQPKEPNSPTPESSINMPEAQIAQQQPQVIAEPEKPPSFQSENVPQETKKTIITPSGDIGELVKSDKGVSEVLIDGKSKRFKEDDIIESPLPETELADLLDDLHKGIEKHTGKEISRMAGFVGYDPEANELSFRSYSGASYNYDNIDPEDIEFLTNAISMRKTSNENYIGAWEEGTKSVIGSKMSELFKKYRERAGKGNKPFKRKFETIYDPYETAHAALKKKKSEERKKAKKSA